MRLPEKIRQLILWPRTCARRAWRLKHPSSYGNLAAYEPSQPTLRQSKRRLDGSSVVVNKNAYREFKTKKVLR